VKIWGLNETIVCGGRHNKRVLSVYFFLCSWPVSHCGYCVRLFSHTNRQSYRLGVKRQKDIISAQKETSEKQIKQIQGQLDEAKRSGRLDDKAFVDELNKGHREIRSYTVQLNRLKARTNLIKRFGAVALPGSAIIATIVLTTIANAVSGNHTAYSLTLWLIGLFTLLFAIFRIFKTLGAIEDVTINSQEAIEKLPEAVKSALIAVELQKKPALVFAFKGGQFPYTAQVGQIINVDCVLSLSSGDSARNIFMFFNAPQASYFLSHLVVYLILHPLSHPTTFRIIPQSS
jgi:ABC-type transport system involved in cytochrome bd biosynthesis fused ATPase/permease subunit